MIHRSKLDKYASTFRILFWIALFSSYILAILPQESAPSIHGLNDKAHHLFAFVVLGVLLRLGYTINYWIAFLMLVGYGAFIEFSQFFTINRSAEVEDILADTVGVFIGLKLYKYLLKVI